MLLPARSQTRARSRYLPPKRSRGSERSFARKFASRRNFVAAWLFSVRQLGVRRRRAGWHGLVFQDRFARPRRAEAPAVPDENGVARAQLRRRGFIRRLRGAELHEALVLFDEMPARPRGGVEKIVRADAPAERAPAGELHVENIDAITAHEILREELVRRRRSGAGGGRRRELRREIEQRDLRVQRGRAVEGALQFRDRVAPHDGEAGRAERGQAAVVGHARRAALLLREGAEMRRGVLHLERRADGVDLHHAKLRFVLQAEQPAADLGIRRRAVGRRRRRPRARNACAAKLRTPAGESASPALTCTVPDAGSAAPFSSIFRSTTIPSFRMSSGKSPSAEIILWKS